VVVEQDTAERERIITRIQALNSAWMELTGENNAASADSKASGKDLATSLKEDLAKYTVQLKEIQAQEDAQRDEVEDMRAKMNASQPVIDRLRQEREVCLTVVRSLWDKIKAINEEYSGLFDAYKEELKEWNERMDVVMAERYAVARPSDPQLMASVCRIE
jgi:chromosome segregation ATPase